MARQRRYRRSPPEAFLGLDEKWTGCGPPFLMQNKANMNSCERVRAVYVTGNALRILLLVVLTPLELPPLLEFQVQNVFVLVCHALVGRLQVTDKTF